MFTIANISKEYPGVKALDDVGFSINKGEVHALVGENGAGKSTLMKVIMGIVKPDNGQLLIYDKVVDINCPKDALKLGISMIFQEINLIPTISIAENIFVGNLPGGKIKFSIDWKKLFRDTEAILEKINLNLNPNDNVSKLSSGQKQLIQLAKAVVTLPKMIIMDEPTASLSSEETEVLFLLIKELNKKGVAVIYISHRLEEIFEIAHRVTVLRDGKFIATKTVSEVSRDELISLMVGRYVDVMYTPKTHKLGSTILKVRNLTKKGLFQDISFDLKQGEILGFYGLIGAGRTELAHGLFGAYSHVEGECFIDNKAVKVRSPEDAVKKGIMYLPEERKEQSIIPLMNIMENLTISNLKEYCRFGFPDIKKEIKISNIYKEKMNIKITSLKQKVMNLSGGNQQKVTLSRLMVVKPKILILDEPTRGIDIGSKAEIHKIIEDLAKDGMAVIVISSDLPEVMAISDDIMTMAYGKITGNFKNTKSLTQEDLLSAACVEESGICM